MTYKDIINRFRQVTQNHLMLQDFGYGQLSDLKTQSQLGPEEQGVDYPYLFLLPGTHQRQGPVMNYQFNMIVMDMARGEEGDQYDNYITIQSQCQQYIDDVLANLYYYYQDQPEIQLSGISYTPFKEKYQDELAGMTATITIQVPTPLNDCIAPIASSTLVVEVENQVDYLLGPDFGQDTAFTYPTKIFDLYNQWDLNRFTITEPGAYRFEIVQPITVNEPAPGESIPNVPVILEIPTYRKINPTSTQNWPTVWISDTREYVWYATYNVQVTAGTVLEFIVLDDVVGQPETTIYQRAGGLLKIYKLD